MKTNRILLLASVFLVLSLAVPSVAEDPATYKAWTAWFKARDPLADAAKNFAENHIHVLSAMGLAKYYPGLDSDEGRRIEKKYGERPIKGTSDAVEGKAHWAYLEAMENYAFAYNRATVKLLKKAGRE